MCYRSIFMSSFFEQREAFFYLFQGNEQVRLQIVRQINISERMESTITEQFRALVIKISVLTLTLVFPWIP